MTDVRYTNVRFVYVKQTAGWADPSIVHTRFIDYIRHLFPNAAYAAPPRSLSPSSSSSSSSHTRTRAGTSASPAAPA